MEKRVADVNFKEVVQLWENKESHIFGRREYLMSTSGDRRSTSDGPDKYQILSSFKAPAILTSSFLTALEQEHRTDSHYCGEARLSELPAEAHWQIHYRSGDRHVALFVLFAGAVVVPPKVPWRWWADGSPRTLISSPMHKDTACGTAR